MDCRAKGCTGKIEFHKKQLHWLCSKCGKNYDWDPKKENKQEIKPVWTK